MPSQSPFSETWEEAVCSAIGIFHILHREIGEEHGAGHLLGEQELNQCALARHQIVSAAKKVEHDKP